jgi:hypothetical protein
MNTESNATARPFSKHGVTVALARPGETFTVAREGGAVTLTSNEADRLAHLHLSPAEARELAADLLAMADHLDPVTP